MDVYPAMLINSSHTGIVVPAVGTAGQLPAIFYGSGIVAAPSESGLTVAGSKGKKRQREPISFLGEDLSAQLNQQMLDLDNLIIQHTERMRAELAERRKSYARHLEAALEHGISKRLKAKDDEIEKVKKLNLAMEERIRSLCAENQIWRELAQTNEATANLLRTNLEQLLAAQMRVKEEQQRCDDTSATDDAESCCCGENDDREAAASAKPPARSCRRCGEREASVLLLPCRHLCLCPGCSSAADSCPVCNCFKSGSVNNNQPEAHFDR
ncbi:hypothetical protein HPP92_017747 [Vanilla planifolia]|uniref:RING-type domain-containing protein n=1 Tax=Vanilla planifolia TaxID=51239 RepID=A0A835QEB0_VANPL|nr:hypothetical protein HPP92_017747 [Vanilla planifolia]